MVDTALRELSSDLVEIVAGGVTVRIGHHVQIVCGEFKMTMTLDEFAGIVTCGQVWLDGHLHGKGGGE